jgi:AcrR family transcriptional regulator
MLCAGRPGSIGGVSSESRRKAELLDALVRYLLRRGVSDLSLRPAAAVLGTTALMLIYYFGLRERLLFAAMRAFAHRLRHGIQEVEGSTPFGSTPATPHN